MLDLIWTKLCLSPTTYCAVVKSGNGALQGAVQDVVQEVRCCARCCPKRGGEVWQRCYAGCCSGCCAGCCAGCCPQVPWWSLTRSVSGVLHRLLGTVLSRVRRRSLAKVLCRVLQRAAQGGAQGGRGGEVFEGRCVKQRLTEKHLRETAQETFVLLPQPMPTWFCAVQYGCLVTGRERTL